MACLLEVMNNFNQTVLQIFQIMLPRAQANTPCSQHRIRSITTTIITQSLMQSQKL